MSRIQGTDTMMDVITKMAEGNPGAISAMGAMLKEGKRIDPWMKRSATA